MKALDYFKQLFLRFKYPVCLPTDITAALGIKTSNVVVFEEFVQDLVSPLCIPTRLKRMMRRELAEEAFFNAQRKEKFKEKTLISYYFPQGWLEFILCFDDHSRLRRMYVQHKFIAEEHGVEIFLSTQVFSKHTIPELQTRKMA